MQKYILTLVFAAVAVVSAFYFLGAEQQIRALPNDNPATMVGLNDTVFYEVKKALLPTINKLIAYNRWDHPADHVNHVSMWINPFTIDDI